MTCQRCTRGFIRCNDPECPICASDNDPDCPGATRCPTCDPIHVAVRRAFAANVWRFKVGRGERPVDANAVARVDFEALARTEWSHEFEGMMRRRLMLGALRYGRMGAKGKPQFDRATAIARRIERYARTGNVDLLADVANLALLEFVEGTHPDRHMDGSAHVETVDTIDPSGYSDRVRKA